MQSIFLLVALFSSLATVVFIVSGLYRVFVRHESLGRRAFLAMTIVSLVTCAFTIWQLLLVTQQLRIGQ